MTDSETGTGVPVTEDEIAELLEGFRPGEVVPSLKLFVAYDKLMKSYRQPLASRTALGRALTTAGCERVRKQKRIKGGGIQETSCWRLPGSVPDAEDDKHARAAIDRVGTGIIPDSRIYDAYLQLASENGWRGRMEKAKFARVLTRLRLHRMREKGQYSRFIGEEHLSTWQPR